MQTVGGSQTPLDRWQEDIGWGTHCSSRVSVTRVRTASLPLVQGCPQPLSLVIHATAVVQIGEVQLLLTGGAHELLPLQLRG